MVWKIICFYAVLIFLPASTYAASFSMKCDAEIEKAAGCTVIMTGEIIKGDNQRFIEFLQSQKKSGINFFRVMLLKSPGGNIPEALLIAQTVIENALDTATTAFWRPALPTRDSYCVSACFLIWVAGAERMHFSSPAKSDRKPYGLGLHRPYFSKDDFSTLDPLSASKSQQELVAQIRSYLKRHDVPENLIDEMIKRSSKEIYWLDSMSGSDDLDQRAPWFEELMISRCGFDPNVVKEDAMEHVREIQTGIKTAPEKRKKYLEWRQNYNSCEYAFRKSSQEKFIAGK